MSVEDEVHPYHVAIISSERCVAVPRMEALLQGLDPVWYVPEGQEPEYEYAGAQSIVGVPSGHAGHRDDGELRTTISDQRNAALAEARGNSLHCVQFNDDLDVSRRFRTGLVLMDADGEQSVTPLQAIHYIVGLMLEHGAHLGGIATTTNKMFAERAGEVGFRHFIMGQLMVMHPEDDGVWFRRRFGSKEDYDFTCAQIQRWGKVARANKVLGNFKHNEKRGGWGAYRSLEGEKRLADMLVEEWAPHVSLNKRREGEVLIRWKG